MKIFKPEEGLIKPSKKKKSKDSTPKDRCPVCLISERNRIVGYDHVNPRPDLFKCDLDAN